MFGFFKKKRPKKEVSPLKLELFNLEKKIKREEYELNELESEFWRDGGTCCPSCGIPGFSYRTEKQEARRSRVEYLNRKLYLSEHHTQLDIDRYKETINAWIDQCNGVQPLGVDKDTRLSFISSKYKISPNRLQAYLEGTTSISHWITSEICEWCIRNWDIMVPQPRKGICYGRY